jgi:hypothetical protein
MIPVLKVNNLTKVEAYNAMVAGYKIRNEYYSEGEYAFINKDGLIETEDGCVHGSKLGEFWSVYQKWEDGWSIIEEVFDAPDTNSFKDLSRPEPFIISAPKIDKEFENMKYAGRPAVELSPVRTGLKIQRNDPCPCGCGKKFKNCINK